MTFLPDFSDNFWMMGGLDPENSEEPTEDSLSDFPDLYDTADQYDDNENDIDH